MANHWLPTRFPTCNNVIMIMIEVAWLLLVVAVVTKEMLDNNNNNNDDDDVGFGQNTIGAGRGRG